MTKIRGFELVKEEAETKGKEIIEQIYKEYEEV